MNWLKILQRKLPLIILIGILLLAAYLRLYHISDYMTFLGDEGRDVLIAKGILEGDFTLLGPRASAGDFYLGPIYYYLIAPWLFLFRFDPVGPAVMVALFGIATTWLTYYVGKKWFNTQTGLIAAALYTVSPVVITYSHSSWNPNVLPFFALLLIYLTYQSLGAKKPWKYFLGIGFLLGIALQLHYLALFLCVIVAVYTFVGQWYVDKRIRLVSIVLHYLQLLGGFLVGFSPFLLFEFRHGFPNIKTIIGFIFADTTQQGYVNGSTFFSTVGDVFFRVFAKLVFYFPSPDRFKLFTDIQLQFFAGFVLVIACLSLVNLWFAKNKRAVILTYLWFFIGVILFGLYKKSIYDYYFAFLFPLPFLLIGNFLAQLAKLKRYHFVVLLLSITLFLGIFCYSLSGLPFQYEPNRQKEQTKQIAEAVLKQAAGKPYNFALISAGNSDHAYRYYLSVLGNPPVVIENPALDPNRKSVTKQLVVVCEDITCKPLGHPLFDVAAFGRAQIVKEEDVSVVKVFKLKPYQ